MRGGGISQGVVFPSDSWGRVLDWPSMTRVGRIYVE